MTTTLDVWPRGVVDPLCPVGHVIAESTERRMLWDLEGWLAVHATTAYHREKGAALRRYLHDTCQHHWHEYAAGGDIPAHRQCLWCNLVGFATGNPDQPWSDTVPEVKS